MRLIICCEILDKDDGDRLHESNFVPLCHAHKASLTYPVLDYVKIALIACARSILIEWTHARRHKWVLKKYQSSSLWNIKCADAFICSAYLIPKHWSITFPNVGDTGPCGRVLGSPGGKSCNKSYIRARSYLFSMLGAFYRWEWKL